MLKRASFFFALFLTFLPCWGAAGTILQAFEPTSLQSIMEQHKGKPFVLLVWSLDCVYCQASLEHLAQAKRTNKALTIVTLSTDAAGDPQAVEMMEKRLTGLQLARDAWAFGTSSSERLNYALDPKWQGEKPRSYWYNRHGERIAYSGILIPDTIEKLYLRVSK